MNRSHGQSAEVAFLLCIVMASGGGCAREESHADSSGATPVNRPAAVIRDTSRAAILQEAESLYTYGPRRRPLARNDPDFQGPVVNDKELPEVRIATATLRNPLRRPRYRIIARIESKSPYDSLGLGKGYSYVWRNSWDDRDVETWVTKIIPSDRSRPEHVLVRDYRTIPYTHGEAREPRLVRIKVHSSALGLCIDDPKCGGHCGYY